MISLEQTEALVREKFADLTPGADHMERVVGHLGGEDEYTLHAAWLHDIVEDTPITIQDLFDMGYPSEVVDAVELLTRDKKGETYAEYIDRICQSGNIRAIKVKLADNQDNTDPRRAIEIPKWTRRSLMKRYKGVREKLLEAAVHATL